MQRYDFEVLQGDALLAAERSVMLRDSKAAWPRIAKLAHKNNTRGLRIRVSDESGQTVIMMGVETARMSFERGILQSS
jgi:hypothetical protein